jgi:4-coumarate--CoA ligase
MRSVERIQYIHFLVSEVILLPSSSLIRGGQHSDHWMASPWCVEQLLTFVIQLADFGSEMVHQITNTEAKVILAHPTMIKTALAAAARTGLPKSRIFQFSDSENPPLDGVSDWRSLIGTPSEGSSYSWPKLSPEESVNTVATINYSSGTTGLPKGVCVSHHNIIANVEQTIFMKYLHKPFTRFTRPPERWIGFLPLYHAYGQLYTILMAAKLLVPVYVMKQFVYADFLRSIQDYKVTHLQVAPPILVMLSKRAETANYDISSVTDILCGAAPLSKELQNDVSRRFNVQINQGWGMTEVTCGAMYVPGGVNDDTGSVGQLYPNTECKLLDDDYKEVGIGEPGEIYIRGPQVCLRYWRNEKATEESIDGEGWLRTGDVALCDERGYFWIVDRKKVGFSNHYTESFYRKDGLDGSCAQRASRASFLSSIQFIF